MKKRRCKTRYKTRPDTYPVLDRKHLTRYSRERTSFDGWRVCISKSGLIFTKYMSDREFGGMEGSYEAARALRDEIVQRLEHEPADQVIAEYRNKFADRRKAPRRRPSEGNAS